MLCEEPILPSAVMAAARTCGSASVIDRLRLDRLWRTVSDACVAAAE